MKTIFETLRQILGRQGLWLAVAIVAVLIPFVATTFELSKEFARYPVGTIAFAAITVILLGTMAAALRTKPTDLPPPSARLPASAAGAQTQAGAQAQPAKSAAKAQSGQGTKPKK